jgi:hypothetical protein
MAAQAVDQRTVGGGQALHVHVGEGLGEQARDDQPVLQQVAQARRRLRALRHHPPVAVRPARQVEGRDVQVGAAHRHHTVHGAQVARVATHQRRRQQAVLEQLARAVHVGHHPVKHAHALQHASLNLPPALGRHDQREQVQLPGALRTAGVGVDVVADPVVADLALQRLRAPVQVGEARGAQCVKELGPFVGQLQRVGFVVPRGPSPQFVEVAFFRRRRQCSGHARWREVFGCIGRGGRGRVFHSGRLSHPQVERERELAAARHVDAGRRHAHEARGVAHAEEARQRRLSAS